MMEWVGLKQSSCSTHFTWLCSVLGGVEQCQGSESRASAESSPGPMGCLA